MARRAASAKKPIERVAGGVVIEKSEVTIGEHRLAGILTIPQAPAGLVISARRCGSNRFSARNSYAADRLAEAGFATLGFDPSTEAENQDRRNDVHIPLWAARLVEAIDWAASDPRTGALRVGLYGVGKAAPAALIAAGARAERVGAIVSRSGRPDLAGAALAQTRTPTLLIVGGEDRQVISRNLSAMKAMHGETSLELVPGAGNLFEEEGALDRALAAAGQWFAVHLPAQPLVAGDRGQASSGSISLASSSGLSVGA